MSNLEKSAQIHPFHVIVVAAGNGTRSGFDTPKQYMPLQGVSLLRHSLDRFVPFKDSIRSIRVVIGTGHESFYQSAIDSYPLPLCAPVIGGSTRKDSVYNALIALANDCAPDDIVLIHDSARPFVSSASIRNLAHTFVSADVVAATLACPVVDTLVNHDYTPYDRNDAFSIQTPQAARYQTLIEAHTHFKDENSFTDDVGLIRALGHAATLVPSPRDNFKITTKEDFAMAEVILSASRQTRTAMGYDVHAFDNETPATSTKLGGVSIPATRRLKGHSDADVVLHALTDALLGTIGDGDIGQIFPPSDMTWKDADSTIFVAEAVRRVHAKGGQVIHADISIIAEEPKIGPHRAAIQSSIAKLLSLPTDHIGLKATTAEGLGFVGRKEGIESHVMVTVTFPCHTR